MRDFIITLITCSAIMSLLGLAYIALTPLLARRYSAKSRYYTWLIIIIGLIIPFRPSFGEAIVKYDLPSEIISPISEQSNTATAIIPSELNVNIFPIKNPSISLWQITALIWFIGMIVFIAFHAIQHYKFLKMVGRWSENIFCEQTLSLLENIKSEMGIERKIELFQCPSISSPMFVGLINPKILLSQDNFTEDELRFILKHELTHYKRRDLCYKSAVLLATAIHWFNPLIYLIVKAIDTACELSCDAEIVQDADVDTRQQYGETIIAVIRHQSKLKTTISTNFYGGKEDMKKRIYSIMNAQKKKTGNFIICSMIVLTLGSGMVFAENKTQLQNIVEATTKASNAMIINERYGITASMEVEYYTYEEYKEFIEKLKNDLNYVIGEKSWGEPTGEFIFAKETVAETIAMYEKTLIDIKNGAKVSKPFKQSNSNNVEEYDYSIYLPYGLVCEYEEGKVNLYYKGKLVRYFEDFYPAGENISIGIRNFNENGVVDVYAIRDFSQIVQNADGSYDPSGILIGIEQSSKAEFDATAFSISSPATPEATNSQATYNVNDDDFFTALVNTDPEQREFTQIFHRYKECGITFEENTINGGLGNVYYKGEIVKLFVDSKPYGGMMSFSSADAANEDIIVSTVYDKNGNLIGIEVLE